MEVPSVDLEQCWLYAGSLNNLGYAMVSHGIKGITRLGHRIMYESMIGAIPPGLQIDHLCRVRCCVNPDHLEPVTAKENHHRRLPYMYEKLKENKCKRGHSLTPDNCYYGIKNKLTGRIGRQCKQCKNLKRRYEYVTTV